MTTSDNQYQPVEILNGLDLPLIIRGSQDHALLGAGNYPSISCQQNRRPTATKPQTLITNNFFQPSLNRAIRSYDGLV